MTGGCGYSESEMEINAVLAYQDSQISAIELPDYGSAESAIYSSEALLSSLGYEPPDIPEVASTKAIVAVPSWEEMLAAAYSEGCGGARLEQLFAEDELLDNSEAVRVLNDQYDEVRRLDDLDMGIAVFAGLLAATVDILLVGIPARTPDGLKAGPLSNYIRDAFDRKFPADEMERLANSKVSKVPYDAQDNRNTSVRVEGLSAYYHRLLSLGHDPLLGFLFGVADIMNGTMTTIDKAGNVVSQVMECYTDRRETDIFVALAKQLRHLASDMTTSMGLPAPTMALFNLMQFGSIGEYEQTVAEIAQGMYYEGYDFIHFCALSVPVAIIEAVTRVGYSLKRVSEGRSLGESLPLTTNRAKLGTMLFIAHSVAAAVNAGKVAFTENPMAINYPQWVAFAKYSYQQLKWGMLTKPAERDRYVRDAIAEELGEVYRDVDGLFASYCAKAIIVG